MRLQIKLQVSLTNQIMLIKYLQNLRKSPKFLKEYIYYQESINKLLMILVYFNYTNKIGDQEITKLVDDTR